MSEDGLPSTVLIEVVALCVHIVACGFFLARGAPFFAVARNVSMVEIGNGDKQITFMRLVAHANIIIDVENIQASDYIGMALECSQCFGFAEYKLSLFIVQSVTICVYTRNMTNTRVIKIGCDCKRQSTSGTYI